MDPSEVGGALEGAVRDGAQGADGAARLDARLARAAHPLAILSPEQLPYRTVCDAVAHLVGHYVAPAAAHEQIVLVLHVELADVAAEPLGGEHSTLPQRVHGQRRRPRGVDHLI